MMLIFSCRCFYWEPYGSICFLLGVLEGEGCIIGALFTVGFCFVFVFTFMSIYFKVLSNGERKYLSGFLLLISWCFLFVSFFDFFFFLFLFFKKKSKDICSM